MKLIEAEIVKQNNLDKVGTVNERGFYVSDIWILPSNEELRKKLISKCLQSERKVLSLEGLEQEDMVVWAVDLRNVESTGLLFFDDLLR